MQTSTASRSYLGTPSTRFIPTSRIQDVLIHEAFRGFEVRHYLAVVVEGEGELTVVFPVRAARPTSAILPLRDHLSFYLRMLKMRRSRSSCRDWLY